MKHYTLKKQSLFRLLLSIQSLKSLVHLHSKKNFTIETTKKVLTLCSTN